jgi:hypothetical protein
MSSYVAGQVLTASSLNAEFAAVPPIGAVIMWAGATTSLPTGWIMCDGTGLATTGTYASLFAVLQYRYGGSAGTFYVPKLNASYIPIGTSALNADLSRQTTSPSITVSSSNHASTGHAHTFASSTTSNRQSSGHTHTFTVGSQSTNHQHNFSTGDQSVTHYHNYVKSNTSNIGAQTSNTSVGHTHNGSTSIQTLDANHSHSVNANANADSNHSHTVTASVNATTTDTAHSHTLAASFMVFIIRYV